MYYFFDDSKHPQEQLIPTMEKVLGRKVARYSLPQIPPLSEHCVIVLGAEVRPGIMELLEQLKQHQFTGMIYLIDQFNDSRYSTLLHELGLAAGLNIALIGSKTASLSMALKDIREHRERFEHSTPLPAHALTDDAKSTIAAAVIDGKIAPHFQAQFYCDSSELYGVEALARLTLDGQTVPTHHLFTVLEEQRLWPHLTEAMFAKVFRAFDAITEAFGELPVAVNLSVTELTHPDLLTCLSRGVERYGVPWQRVKIELIESEIFNTQSKAAWNLAKLASHGMGLSIDDYGKGYANAFRLSSAPFNELKVDKHFVRQAHHNIGRAVLSGAAMVSGQLNMNTVAEGVETEKELLAVKEQGITAAQGFLLHKPEPLENFLSRKF